MKLCDGSFNISADLLLLSSERERNKTKKAICKFCTHENKINYNLK